jgi:hypothetical protein
MRIFAGQEANSGSADHRLAQDYANFCFNECSHSRSVDGKADAVLYTMKVIDVRLLTLRRT